jgi:aldose sugar dehydrogenase
MAFAAALPLLGCADRDTTRATPAADMVVETVASGLVVPWALAFDPDGRLFVSERGGQIRLIVNDSLQAAPWATVPVEQAEEAGLLGIAVAPDFAQSRHIYVVGTFSDGESLVNRVLRYTEENGAGATPQVIVDALPASRYHAGAALAFGPDGMLYVTTGDSRQPRLAQDPQSLAGKVLRYTPEGGIPDDNPIAGSPVYALGVRNPQGLHWNEDGQLFATEHGPSGFPNENFRRGRDELNAIVAGGNYAWPEVAGTGGAPEYIDPLIEWSPAIAPSGLAVYTGDRLPWRGSVIVAGLRGQQLRRVLVERDGEATGGWRAVSQEVLVDDQGRLRAVAMGPDGHLYFTTSNRDGRGSAAANDDRVLRIVARSERDGGLAALP